MTLQFEIWNNAHFIDGAKVIGEVSGTVNLEKLKIELSNGSEFNVCLPYFAINAISPKWSPVEKVRWLLRQDDHVWYRADDKHNSQYVWMVRKSGDKWISFRHNRVYELKDLVFHEPKKKFIHCKQYLLSSNGGFVESTQFVWETPKSYIRSIDGKKIRYDKRNESLLRPIGYKDLDEDTTHYLYVKK